MSHDFSRLTLDVQASLMANVWLLLTVHWLTTILRVSRRAAHNPLCVREYNTAGRSLASGGQFARGERTKGGYMPNFVLRGKILVGTNCRHVFWTGSYWSTSAQQRAQFADETSARMCYGMSDDRVKAIAVCDERPYVVGSVDVFNWML